jgi:uncharacterized membrane protein required for colicin V production
MWLNAIAFLVLAACVAAGAWNGALATGLRIATLVLAYGLALVLAPVFAPSFAGAFGGEGLLATLTASSVVFLVAYAVLAIASRYARRLGPRANVGRSPRDRFLGACFGAVRGAFVAMMVVYLAMWLDALRATGSAPIVPELGDSVAAEVTGGVVEGALASTVDTADPAARFVTHFASHPAAAAGGLQALLDDPSFVTLRADTRFWNDVEDGNVDAALQRSSFRALADDAQVRHQAAQLGLVSEESARDADAFRQSIAGVFEEIAPRLRGLRDDPAVRELLADPEVVARLQNGDTLALLTHPKFRELVARISAPAR